MRHKLVIVVLAVAIPVGMLLATQTMASAGSTVNATGSVACSGASGNIKLTPGWETNSNTLPAPSKASFNVQFFQCSATHPGNITTKVFGGHLKGSVNFPSNDCSTNFGAPVAVSGRLPIYWNKFSKVGRLNPAPTDLSLAHVTATFTAGVGIKVKFSHQTLTGSFAAKTFSGELDSSLNQCLQNSGLRHIPITAGNISQP
jgi:hypothetical protein